MNTELKQNKQQAAAHLELLSGQKNSKEVFQIYPDSELCNVKPQILIGTLEQHWDELVRLNMLGAAIAVVVNQTDFNGRSEENVTKIRAFFTDDDENLKKTIAIDPPSFEVVSKNGRHKYYICNGFELELFKPIQRSLAQEAGTDPKVCDLGRAMRLAGFYHMKDINNPFFVKIESDFFRHLQGNFDVSGVL